MYIARAVRRTVWNTKDDDTPILAILYGIKIFENGERSL